MRLRRFAAVLPMLAILLVTHPLHANTATAWNEFALKTLAGAGIDLLEIERLMAIEQIAVYEAANSTQPHYSRSPIAISDAAGASTDAAITEAAFRVLVSLAPKTKDAASAEREAQLGRIPDSARKTKGIAVGAEAAATVLRSRQEDGADFSRSYVPGSGPGAYLPTSERPMMSPQASRMKPFSFASYAEFRPPSPPALDSPQMRRDLDEVKSWGAHDSKLRSADQTEIGLFHAQPGIYSWSEIARKMAIGLHSDEVETALLLAAVEKTVVDAQYAVWDAKYTYNTWRPVTAIQVGGGPLNLVADPGWEPLIATPMIPEYPCAHCGLGSAMQLVLEHFAGRGPQDFSVASGTVTRRYHSFREYAEEESISRIYSGVHYRWSNSVGEAMGRQVGQAEVAALPRHLP